MATYEQVVSGGLGGAGNVDGRNVYKIVFATNDCSDLPQLQAWDDHDMNSVASESLAGTTNNGEESQILAAHTSNIKTGGPWAPAAASAGGGDMQDPNAVGTSHRANRLRGNESYLMLGDVGDVAPVAGEARKFQLAFAVHDDNVVGTSGHRPVLAVKTFYAGAAPDVSFWYNRGEDDLEATEVNADWQEMTHEAKGTPMAVGVKNAIHATGPGTTGTALDPVTKPGSGEDFASEQWIQTAL
jgi:hypothetical protein